MNSEPSKIKGILYEIKDTSILVSSSAVIWDYSGDRFGVKTLPVYNIEIIKTRRKNSIGKGVAIGTLSGIVVGGLIGLISGDDPPCPSGSGMSCWSLDAKGNAVLAGIPLAICGAGVGALIGSVKLEIPINGSIDSYNRNKNKLRGHSIRKK